MVVPELLSWLEVPFVDTEMLSRSILRPELRRFRTSRDGVGAVVAALGELVDLFLPPLPLV